MSALPSVDRSVAVEADATRVLYERYAGRLLGFCMNRLGNREEAEDAVQVTFMNAFRGLRRGVSPEYESAWLFKIAENVCRDGRRAAYRRGRLEETRDLHAVQDVIPAPQHEQHDLVGLADALAAMPENQRRAILLREWQGLSYREISAELGVSVAAVETLIFRGRRTLAQHLEAPLKVGRRRGLVADVLSLLAGLRSLFQGGMAALKVATAISVVAAGTAAVASVPGSEPTSASPAIPAERAAGDVHDRTAVVSPRQARSTRRGPDAPAAAPLAAPRRDAFPPSAGEPPRDAAPVQPTEAGIKGATASVAPAPTSSQPSTQPPALPSPLPPPPALPTVPELLPPPTVEVPPVPPLPSVPEVPLPSVPEVPLPEIEPPALPGLP